MQVQILHRNVDLHSLLDFVQKHHMVKCMSVKPGAISDAHHSAASARASAAATQPGNDVTQIASSSNAAAVSPAKSSCQVCDDWRYELQHRFPAAAFQDAKSFLHGITAEHVLA